MKPDNGSMQRVHESPGGAPRTTVELFAHRVAQTGSKVALRYQDGAEWRGLSFEEWNTVSREIAAGLVALGIGRGDRVCILSSTRAEWVMCDVAILMAGAITVPLYQSNTPEQCEYIVRDSGARVVIAEDADQAAKLARLADVEVIRMGE